MKCPEQISTDILHLILFVSNLTFCISIFSAIIEMNVSVGSSLQGIEETVVVQVSAWDLHWQTMKSALLFAGLFLIHFMVAPAMYQ